MSRQKSVVKVSILGEEFSIRSEATPEHTTAVAEYLDRTIREIMNGGKVADPRKAAILAALQITDELLQSKAAASGLAESIGRLSGQIRPWLPPAKRPR